MREKMVNEKYTSLEVACRKQGEEQIKKMLGKFALPEVCPKPGCGGTKFIRHEDGWQCLNCFKIIYIKQGSDNRHKRIRERQLILV